MGSAEAHGQQQREQEYRRGQAGPRGQAGERATGDPGPGAPCPRGGQRGSRPAGPRLEPHRGRGYVQRALQQGGWVGEQGVADAASRHVGPAKRGPLGAHGGDLPPSDPAGVVPLPVVEGRRLRDGAGELGLQAQDGEASLARPEAHGAGHHVQRDRPSVHRRGDASDQLVGLRTGVGGPLGRVGRPVAIRVDLRHLLECRDLGHVQDVVHLEPAGLHHQAAVQVDGEVAERMGGGRTGRPEHAGEHQARHRHHPPHLPHPPPPMDARAFAATGAYRIEKCGLMWSAVPRSRRAAATSPRARSIIPLWNDSRALR